MIVAEIYKLIKLNHPELACSEIKSSIFEILCLKDEIENNHIKNRFKLWLDDILLLNVDFIIVHICHYQNDIKSTLNDENLKLGCVQSLHHLTIEISNLANEIIN